MKAFAIILLLLFASTSGHSQILKGEWEGRFTDNKKEYPLFLEFILNADSTYSVFTYSQGGPSLQNDGSGLYFREDSIVVCAAYYELLSPDSIYLEEIKVVQPVGHIQACFQKMYLKIQADGEKILLTGTWGNINCRKDSSGKINFWKKKNKPK